MRLPLAVRVTPDPLQLLPAHSSLRLWVMQGWCGADGCRVERLGVSPSDAQHDEHGRCLRYSRLRYLWFFRPLCMWFPWRRWRTRLLRWTLRSSTRRCHRRCHRTHPYPAQMLAGTHCRCRRARCTAVAPQPGPASSWINVAAGAPRVQDSLARVFSTGFDFPVNFAHR